MSDHDNQLCTRCGEFFNDRGDGDEPGLCDNCAQELCVELQAQLAALRAELASVTAERDKARGALADCANELWEICKDESDEPEVGIFGWNRCHAVVATARNILSRSQGGPRESASSSGVNTEPTAGEVNLGTGMGSIPAVTPATPNPSTEV
jgi:hypothetical protein